MMNSVHSPLSIFLTILASMAFDLPIGDAYKPPQRQLFTIMCFYLSAKFGNSSRTVADLCVSNTPEDASVTPPSKH